MGVSGTTVIDGGRIATDSLTASKISGDVTETFFLAIGDQQNYALGNANSSGSGGTTFTQSQAKHALFSMPPASDTTIPKAQFGNLNIVIESSSQYIIRSYAELFIINAGGSTQPYSKSFSDFTFISTSGVSTGYNNVYYMRVQGNQTQTLSPGGLIYNGTNYGQCVGVEYVGHSSLNETRIYYSNLEIQNPSTSALWTLWPSTYSDTLSSNSAIAQLSKRARIGGIFKAASTGINNININFRLPKITHSDDTQFRVRITTVHHSTQSNTTSNNPTSGTAIAMTLPYVGGTFGYSK